MKVEIVGVPQAHFALAPEEVALLKEWGANHYSLECREAANVGGFIHGWSNGPDRCQATNRELQIVLKILESVTYYIRSESGDQLAWALRDKLHRVLIEMLDLNWSHKVEV